MTLPSLDIVIVNWNSGDQLFECIQSIDACDTLGIDPLRLILVDNGSTDGSLGRTDKFGLPMKVIRNSENLGFGAACNQGSEGSVADYILFLNPDTRLLVDSLAMPVQFMQHPENKGIGICGIQLFAESGEIARSCHRHPTWMMFFFSVFGLDKLPLSIDLGTAMNSWDHTGSRKVDHVIGAFLLIRRTVFEDLGGFDKQFFLYFEDLDLTKRTKDRGHEIYYLADARAFHKGGGSSEQIKPLRLFYSLQSRLLYSFKHFHPAAAITHFIATLLIEPVSRLVYAIVRGRIAEVAATLSAYRLLWRDTPNFIRRQLRQNRR